VVQKSMLVFKEVDVYRARARRRASGQFTVESSSSSSIKSKKGRVW